MNPQTIWTVSTIGIHPNERIWTRTWGYYFTREEAIAGMDGCVDTEAGYYTHVIIEQFTPGIYAMAETEEWFVWAEGWKPCEKPESEMQVINYGMG